MSVIKNSLDRSIERLMEMDEIDRKKFKERGAPLDDISYISMLLRANNVHNVIEIGTSRGYSACLLANNITGKYYTIDHNTNAISKAKGLSKTLGIKNIVFIGGLSEDVLPDAIGMAGDGLGAVYIDGKHSYDSVMAEYRLIEPMMRLQSSGAVFFDDAAKVHPDGAKDGGVPRAVMEVGATPLAILDGRVAIKTFGKFRYL